MEFSGVTWRVHSVGVRPKQLLAMPGSTQSVLGSLVHERIRAMEHLGLETQSASLDRGWGVDLDRGLTN
jgi:hypothetical protein